jgi:hypothetical protein
LTKHHLLSVTLDEEWHLATSIFVECKTLCIQWLLANIYLSSVQLSATFDTRQSTASTRLPLTAVNYVECPRKTLGKVLSLPSVVLRHSAKNAFAKCLLLKISQFYLHFFLFAPNIFVICSYSLWTYIFNFGTLIKVFAITIRFSLFNWISLDNTSLNRGSIEKWKNELKNDINDIEHKLRTN